MRRTLLLLLIFALSGSVTYHAEANTISWSQTNVPFGGTVKALAVNSSGYIFAGTDGSGVYLSTDAGTTWSPMNNGLTDLNIYSLVINSSGYIFAGSDSGVYLSTDNGVSWVATSNGLPSATINCFAINSSGYIFAGTNDGVYLSTNNGAIWTAANIGWTGGMVFSLAINGSGNIFAAGSVGDVYLSTDNGTSWTALYNGLPGNSIYSLAINSSGYLFAGTSGGTVYLSTDNGSSWTSVSRDSTGAFVEALAVNSAGDIFAGCSGDGVYVSTNGGTSWTAINYGLASTLISSLAINSSGYVIAGTDLGNVCVSTNDGTNWKALNSALTDVDARSLLINSAGTVFVGTWMRGIFLSTDNGTNWTHSITGRSIDYANVTSLAINSKGYVLAATNGSGVFLTTDNGASWGAVNIGLIDKYVYSFAFDSSGDIFAGTNGADVYLSTDNGSNWTSVGSGLPNTEVLALTINSSGYIFAGVYGYGVYTSTNNGSSWAPSNSGLGNTNVHALAVNSLGYIFAGTDGGVYLSTNNGTNWSAVNNGLPSAEVTSLSINSSGYIFAGVYGSGIYYSTDNGTSWTQINSGLTNTNVYSLAIDSAGYVFAATNGGGVYRSVSSTDNSVPLVPQNLAAVAGSGQVTLRWDEDTGSGVLRYRIYRGTTSGGEVLADSTSGGAADTTKVEQRLLNGTTYYFKVSAVDSTGLESAYSNEVLTRPSLLNSLYEYNPDTSTVLLLHMDETSGSTAVDASAFGNNATAVGTGISAGRFGEGRSFNGSSDYLQVNDAGSLDMTNQITVEMWVDLAVSQNQNLLSKDINPASSGAYQLYVNPSNQVGFGVYSGYPWQEAQTSAPIQLNTWTHVAASFDNSTKEFKIYIDGVLSEDTTIASANLTTTSDPLYIGRNGSSPVYFVDGKIDEVRISDVIRPPQEFDLQLPPVNLNANVIDTTVNLSWQNGGGAAPLMKYRIYRGTDSNDVVLVDSTASLSMQDIVPALGTYFYRISSVDSSGFEGAKSIALKVVANGAPAPPQNLSAYAGSEQVTLRWDENTGSGFLRYRIYRGTTSGGEVLVDSATGGIADTTQTETGLTNGKTYYFKITAVDSSGLESGFSNEAKAAPNVLSQGLVAWYPFTGDASDSSGNGNNGTVNGASLTSDRFGNPNAAYQFDGISQNINCGNNSSLQSSSVSVMCWIDYLDSLPAVNAPTIINKAAKGSDGWAIFVGNGYFVGAEPSHSGAWQGFYCTDTLTSNTWHQVVFTYDSSTQIASLYWDGKLENTENFLMSPATSQDLEIGYGYNTLGSEGTAGFDGKIDGIRIYNYAIGKAEIDSLFHSNGWDSPAAPKGVNAIAGSGQVVIKCDRNSEPDFLEYRLYLGKTSGSETLVDSALGINDTTLVETGLTNGMTYYFKLAAVDSMGLQSGYSNEVSATPIATPTLLSPLNNAFNQPDVDTLKCSAAPGASEYHWQVSANLSFGTFVINDSTSDTLNVVTLTAGKEYHWQVQGTNPSGAGEFGGPDSFSVSSAPYPPMLSTPSNGSSGIATSPILTWHVSQGAESYRLQVSADSTFLSTKFDQSNLADTTEVIGGLANSTKYYWRVNASNAAGSGGWSPVWNFETVAPPPSITVNPGNINFGAVPLNTSSAVQTYIVYGSNLISPVTVQAPNGFLVSRSESGSYSDSISLNETSGTIMDTVWVKFAPASATAYSGTISNTSADSASQYVSVSGTGVTPVLSIIDLRDSIFSATVYSADSLNNWTTSIKPFVKTSTGWQTPNGSGTTDWGEFVQHGAVTSGGVADSDAIYAPTDSTDMATVADYTLSYPDSISLKYGLGDGRQSTYADVRFVVQVKDNNVYTTILDSTVDDSAGWRIFGASLSRWKDSVVTLRLITDPNGVTFEDWSYWADARVEVASAKAPPQSPMLAFPANDTTGADTSLTLTWSASASASSYELQVSTDSTFGTTFLDRAGLTSTSLSLSGLAGGTAYYWRVDAANSAGTSSWSEVWRFTTATGLNTLSAPVLVSPFDSATGLPTQLRFIWNPSPGASTYRLEISTDSTFGTFVIVPNLTLPSDSISTGLFIGTTYYWRVSAANSAGTSTWSDVWHFTTAGGQAQLPPAPILASPVNGATGLPASIRFRWNSSAGARTYELQIATDTSFSAVVSDAAGLTASTDSVDTMLSPGTTYYWRVDASDSAGNSRWSDVWSFTTALPAGPVLAAPSSGTTGLSTSPILSWYRENGSGIYEVEVSADSMFDSYTYDRTAKYDSTAAGLDSQAVNGLAMFTNYYWRVRASYAQVMSEWSQVWSFTTTSGLSVPALLYPFDSSGNIATNPQLSWTGSMYDSTYEIQVSTDSTFANAYYDGRNIPATVQEIPGLSQGARYFWRVDASNSYGSSGWSPVWSFTTFTYPSSISLTEHYTPPASISQTDYEIIGLPGAINIPLSSVMTGTQGKDWNAYWDNGTDQSYFVEYDGSSMFDFTPGKAFWLLSQNSFDIASDFQTVPIDTGDCYSIPLHNGWNLISDPFEKAVNWSDVAAVNGSTNPLWAFTNGSWSQSSTLEPYQGYYFYNSTDLASLRVPYMYSPAPASLRSATKPAAQKNPTVTAMLLDGSGQVSSVSVGLGANQGTADIFSPPAGFERAGMCVIDSSAGSEWKELACDYVDSVGSGRQFDFFVSNKTGQNLDLHFDVGDGFAGYEVYLVDKDLSRSYDLNDTSRIVIPSYNKVKDFAILIGDKSYVDRKLAELVPHEFVLYQNYPNPFNPVTVIRFEIPSTEHVSLTVYDVLGRRVETLMDGEVTPGYYEVPFDGTRYASGVYFYRIVAGRSSQVKKMMLLK